MEDSQNTGRKVEYDFLERDITVTRGDNLKQAVQASTIPPLSGVPKYFREGMATCIEPLLEKVRPAKS